MAGFTVKIFADSFGTDEKQVLKIAKSLGYSEVAASDSEISTDQMLAIKEKLEQGGSDDKEQESGKKLSLNKQRKDESGAATAGRVTVSSKRGRRRRAAELQEEEPVAEIDEIQQEEPEQEQEPQPAPLVEPETTVREVGASADVEQLRREASERKRTEREDAMRDMDRSKVELQERKRKVVEDKQREAEIRSQMQDVIPAKPSAPDGHSRRGATNRSGGKTKEDRQRNVRQERGERGGGNRMRWASDEYHVERRRGRKQGKLRADGEAVFFARSIKIIGETSVIDIAHRMAVKVELALEKLVEMGVQVEADSSIDSDTATLLVEEMGHKAVVVAVDKLEAEIRQQVSQSQSEPEPRAPVVVIMGHVDHGKTSLLDHLRKTQVVEGEAGGITQHIGAYRVTTPSGDIAFLDTPGHAAFTQMRARGARCTDIVILVIDATDGVQAQTEEAIQHARAAGVAIIVAYNKIDLEGADTDKIQTQLAGLEVVPEALGGDVQCVPISAKTGEGVDDLLAAVLVQAEVLALTAPANGPSEGTVIEARIEHGRGTVVTLLVQKGCLKPGDMLVAGTSYGRVRSLLGDGGKTIKQCGPSEPVEVLGLNQPPEAGVSYVVVDNERKAREWVSERLLQQQEQNLEQMQMQQVQIPASDTLDDEEDAEANYDALFEQSEIKELNLLLKTDVHGSAEAIKHALSALGNEEVCVNIVSMGVGAISEADIMLAQTTNSQVFGFNVRADQGGRSAATKMGVQPHYYSIIYGLIEDIEQMLKGMMKLQYQEQILGVAEVRDVFRAPRFGQIAGCMVVDGLVQRNKPIRVLRDDVVIYEGHLESLRHVKEDVNEARQGTECGVGVRNYEDVKVGDRIEVYEAREVEASA